jgi:hypothetical protein
MAPVSSLKSTSSKVRAYRARLRAQGLRPIQLWVPDIDSEEFRAEAKRQSAAVAASPYEAEDQAFINSISVDLSDEPWEE